MNGFSKALFCASLVIFAVCIAVASGYRLEQRNAYAEQMAELEPAAGYSKPKEHIVRFYKAVDDPRMPEAVDDVEALELEESVEVQEEQAPEEAKFKVAIVIDDMGMDRTNGFRLIEMDAPLTLAFLPYAESLQDITEAALNGGHELMIHMPMQPMNDKLDLGTIALKVGMDSTTIDEQLDLAFSSFNGYVGLNNHMGSRLTQDSAAMKRVMERLKERDLYFIDSKTISTSVAGGLAKEAGLKTVDRDVFLDHVDSLEFVEAALQRLEKTAMRQGYAIAIGHPKDATIEGLEAWLPTLAEKGIEVVHASELVNVYPDYKMPVQPVAEPKLVIEVEAEIETVPDAEAEENMAVLEEETDLPPREEYPDKPAKVEIDPYPEGDPDTIKLLQSPARQHE